MKKRTKPIDRTLNVLFIGNSFTARNDLPGLVAILAASAGLHLDHKLLGIGGASLRTHWNKGEALKAIEAGHYDFVVLQEQSTLPIKNSIRMHENVRLFDERIKAAGAKTALYMTWARQHAPESQAAITDAYASISREIGAALIPAGLAWKKCLNAAGNPVLHDRDGSHPTLAGSYLAACVAFGSLFRSSPVGLRTSVDGLDDPTMQQLQRVAGATLK